MSKKLYKLIKSLTPTEKAHFKKYSSGHLKGQKVYIALFDVIDNMGEYQRSSLQAAFKKKKSMDALAVYSNYLFANIMDALKVYHGRKTADSAIKHLILDAELLLSKNLYPEAEKTIGKARDKAHRYGRSLLLLEAIGFEQKLALKSVDISLIEKVQGENYTEKLKILEKLKITFQYEWLYFRFIKIVVRLGVHIKNEKDLKEMDIIMGHPLLRSELNAPTIYDKDIYFLMHSFYNYVKLKQDLKVSIKFGLKRKELFENNIDWASQRLESYVSLLDTLCNYYALIRNVKEHAKLLEDLEILPEKFGNKITERLNNQRLADVRKQFLIHCFISKQYEKALAAVKGKEAEWEEVMKKGGGLMLHSFYCNMFELFIHVKNYKKALFWNNKVINDTESAISIYIRIGAMLWNIIIHFELGNFDLIGSLITTTFNLLDNEQLPYVFERFFLDKMYEVVDAQYKGKTETGKVFTEFKRELIRFKRKTHELREIDYEDYMTWICSHI